MQRSGSKRISALLLAAAVFISAHSITARADSSLDEIKQHLTFAALSSEPISAVTQDFVLPVSFEGAFIVWESDDENVISIDGTTSGAHVIRPPFGEGYVSTVLTANITLNEEMTKKRFLVRVCEQDIGFTYSQTILDAYKNFEMEFLSRQNVFGITGDIYIPLSSNDNVKISCSSNNPSVLTNDGKVTRNFESDNEAIFTAIFTEGFESFKVSYPLTIKAYTDEEIRKTAQDDLDTIVNGILNRYNCLALESDMQLPSLGAGGSTITWETSDKSVITDTGKITRSKTRKTATLKATATFHGAVATADLDVAVENTVSSIAPTTSNPGISGGGGGGGTTPTKPAEPEPTDTQRFSDVPKTHWGYEAIEALAKQGVVSGMTEGVFAPDNTVTREQAVKIILLGTKYIVSSEGEGFDDTPDGAWFTPYIKTAKRSGIVNGISSSHFGVGQFVTRQDIAVMLYKAAKNREIDLNEVATPSFADEGEISPYAKEAVHALAAAGIIGGYGGDFKPKAPATRAEICAMIYRMVH